MDDIRQLLENRVFDEPSEIKIIKKFIKNSFGEECLVKVSKLNINIIVSNSALAGALKEDLEDLKKQLGSQKRISISIGKI
jgi:AmiR/NasT family two-component response regulator